MKTQTIPFLTDAAPAVALAVLGKHPLSADHLEDIGLVTPSLIAFKQRFYVDGIADALARQVWLRDLGSLDEVPYNHHLLCVGTAGWMAARLVRSSDSVGRRQFPLILALHSGNLALLHQIGGVTAVLETCKEALIASTDAASMRHAHDEALKSLVNLETKAGEVPPPASAQKESWLKHMPKMGVDCEGLKRCCHALLPIGAGAGKARLPLHPQASWPSATMWASFLRTLLDARPSLTFIWRQDRPFADAWLHPPDSRALANIFAEESTQPMTTDVPFAINADLAEKVAQSMGTWLKSTSLFSDEPEAPAAEKSFLSKIYQNVFGKRV